VGFSDTWSAKGFSLDPAAPRTGPFPKRAFLETWWRHRGPADDARPAFLENDTALLTLVEDGATIRFCGPAHLTDYHSPLGTGTPDLIAQSGRSAFRGRRLELNSLPAEAAAEIAAGLASAGIPALSTTSELTAVLTIPATSDAWLAAMRKKDRHELRRKVRRFTQEHGSPELVRGADDPAFDEFVALHRRAPGEKGEFMTDRMAAFFRSLVAEAGAVLDLLIAGGQAYAAAFGFEDERGYYAYNAAYDPSAAPSSPGIVLHAAIVNAQIERGGSFIDFLKGAEAYKFRLGAQPRPLYRIESEIV
jgi:CelD/BcsL family acetyltransferase involved in cellulose biosynthesis